MPYEPQPSTQRDRTPPWRMGWAVWLATGSWVGLIPIMPGTIGALWGLPLAYAIGQIDSIAIQIAIIFVLILLAIPVCTAAARQLGRKDPGAVTLDEIVSVPITFLLHPTDNLAILAVGFVLHRVFDILKPPPARQFERLPEGWGIVADDLVAGVYSNLALWLVIWLGLLDRFL